MRNLHAPRLAASAVLSLFGAMTLAHAAQPLRVSGHTAGSAATVNWPQPGLDAQHTGYNAQETTISKANIGRLTQKWAVPIPNGIQEAAPVEVNGIAYAQATDGIVYAVNVTTGALLWTYPGQFLGLTAGGGLVYTTCKVDANGHSGVCALNGTTGVLVWSFTVSNVGGQVPTSSAADNVPVFERGVVYFGESYGGFDSPVSGDIIVALNAATGTQVWSAGYTDKTNGQPFAIDKGAIFYQSSDGSGNTVICGIQTADGTGSRCSPALSSNSSAAVSVSGGKVLTTYNDSSLSNTYFTALDEASLAIVWSQSVPGFTSGSALFSPAVAGVLAYFNGGQNGHGSLYALSLKTGAQRWAFHCSGSTTGCPKSGVSVANGVLFASCLTPNLGDQCSFNAKTGALLRLYGSTDNNAGTSATPLVANGAEIGACGDYGGNLCLFAR